METTSIFLRYIQNHFFENTFKTVCFDKNNKDIIVKNCKKIKPYVTDTAGQEKYQSLNKSHVKNIDGVLIVFDLNNKATFYNIKKWINFFDEIIQFLKWFQNI